MLLLCQAMSHYEKYLITAALPYANGPLHIGHLAGAYLSSDIYARFLRLQDKEVVFVCGSDEHGAAITIKALKEGSTPQDIVDKYHNLFKDTFEKIGVSFDIYHRTSSELHHETSQEFFTTLYDKGIFETRESEQYYDPKANQFLADRYIQGTCPNCSFAEAYGDQCESCGSTLSPTDLINPISKISGDKPIKKKTTHWYLPLNNDEAWIKEWVEEGTLEGKELHDPSDWKNHVVGQCKSWIENGLHPRAMTRDLDWGVDVPQSIEGSEGKKLYVWLDAPIGYISATKQWAKDNDKNWEDYWKSDDTALVHFIGKDNIVFHCIIFPSILRSHGGYNLPVNVPANQFMNLEGRKISTSKNWAVWVHEYLEDLPGREDALRYCMIKHMPELKDSEFTWKTYQEANNNELVNNVGNFVNRAIVLINKYYEGVLPEYDAWAEIEGPQGQDELTSYEGEIIGLFDNIHRVYEHIHKYDFRGGLKTIMEISTMGNQLLQNNAPWQLIKEDEEAVKTIMMLVTQYVGALRVVLRPYLPFASDKLSDLLNLPHLTENGEWVEMMDKLAEGEDIVPAGHKISEASHLFTRIDDDVITAQVDKLNASLIVDDATANGNHAAVKETISFDDFTKLDLRTATIVSAEKVKKTNKLLKLELDLGFETRTVVSGIAKSYDPETIIGKKVTLLANLAPRKIKGIESQGMILMADDGDESLCFISPEKDDWSDGMTIS